MVKSVLFESDNSFRVPQTHPDENRMIAERITIHDKYQFETKLVYHLDPGGKDCIYDLENYFFFPQNLHINPNTYSKEQFYSDIQSYIRFKTPSVPLRNLTEGKDNPLSRLSESLAELRVKADAVSTTHYLYRLRLFCCIVKSCLRDHVSHLSLKTDDVPLKEYIAEYLHQLQQTLSCFRATGENLSLSAMNEERHRKLFAFADEYLSMLAEDSVYEISQIIGERDFADKPRILSDLIGLAKKEIEYRREQNYPSIPMKDSDNEEFIYRKGALKKYMGSVLFLNTRMEKAGRLLEQLLLGFAAGVAMVFATGIAFFYQYWYGVLSVPFFVALVVSYMFKDRIKELARVYLTSAARNILFDHKTTICAKEGMRIGYCSESFDFVDQSKIPEDIHQFRERDSISELENEWLGENVIRYRKRIRIFSAKIRQIYHGSLDEGLTDIMRLNVQRFLNKMDNPKRLIRLPDGDSYRTVSGRRVYHVNMILRYRVDHESILERYRLVLNRGGIKRIELVDTMRSSTAKQENGQIIHHLKG